MRRPVQESPAALLAGEQLVAARIEDDPGNQFPRFFQGQSHVVNRISVREVGGAVQRVHIPAIFGGALVAAALLRHDAVIRKAGFEPLHDQLLRSSVGLGHQIESAFQFEMYMTVEIVSKQRSGLMRDFNRAFQIIRHYRLRDLVQILDVVLEDEQVGRARSRDANKALIVILDHAAHFLVIAESDADGNSLFDQVFQVLDFFERLLRRPRDFSL